jgi:thiol-disulfide isomerase/thioredoxin
MPPGCLPVLTIKDVKKGWLYIFLIAGSLTELSAQNHTFSMVNFAGFEPYLSRKSDTVYVINFWATWCGPCRRELPGMEKIHKDYSGKKVKVLLVSLDFPNQQKSLQQFLSSNKITAPVILLNEPDANAWIDKVDPSWTGALPATLIFKGSERKFFEKELSYEEVNNSIISLKP